MKTKILFFTLSFIILSQVSNSFGQQVFRKTIVDQSMQDFDYSSVLEFRQQGVLNGYVVTGTRFNDHPFNNRSNSSIVFLDVQGNVVWNKLLNNATNEACLDAVIGYDNRIVTTGYIEDSGVRRVLVNELDVFTGTLITSMVYDIDPDYSSMGLTIAYDSRREQYIIGGTAILNLSDVNSRSKGFVLKLNNQLSTVWTKQFVGNGEGGLTGINDIFVYQRGIFITGTYLEGIIPFPLPATSVQGMTAVMLRHNGSVKWDLSHNSSNESHMGIHTAYEPDNLGTLYLLSNNSEKHNFQITVIQNANTTSPVIAHEYIVDINTTPGLNGHSPIGLSLQFSQSSNNELVVMGMLEYANYSISTNQSPMFLVRFNKNSGLVSNAMIHTVESTNYATFSPSLLNQFNSHIIRVYSPSSMVLNDEEGYTFLGHRHYNATVFNTEIVSSNSSLNVGDNCNLEVFSITSYSLPLEPNVLLDFTPLYPDQIEHSADPGVLDLNTPSLCPPGGEKSLDVEPEKAAEQFNIYPNPADNELIVQMDFDDYEDVTIVVTDLSGKLILQTQMQSNKYLYNTTDVENGIYLISLFKNQELIDTKKLVVQH